MITLLTFDTILTEMCDTFDTLIAPRKIQRANTNIIYLMLKAIAKGYEIINNVCVALQSKFNPETCDNEDLLSVAKLVGTEKLAGSASGLLINVKNTDAEADKVLLAGLYTYKQSEEVVFSFEVTEDTTVDADSDIDFIATSNNLGSYPVTAQESISVESELSIDSAFTFSCGDNAELLGFAEETDIDFRRRILTDVNRQDALSELQTTLRNLPYIFDCCIYFNNSFSSVTYDGYTVPAYSLLVMLSGSIRNEIADIVASKGIYPTVQTADSVMLRYNNSVFVDGYFPVYVQEFKKKQFTLDITYKIDALFADPDVVEENILNYVKVSINRPKRIEYIKENTIYDIIKEMNLAGVEILNVDILYDDTVVDYLEIPYTRLPELTDITFTQV